MRPLTLIWMVVASAGAILPSDSSPLVTLKGQSPGQERLPSGGVFVGSVTSSHSGCPEGPGGSATVAGTGGVTAVTSGIQVSLNTGSHSSHNGPNLVIQSSGYGSMAGSSSGGGGGPGESGVLSGALDIHLGTGKQQSLAGESGESLRI